MSRIVDAVLAPVEENRHAPKSPSKAHRWLVCPGSMHVTAEDPESEWAAEGTRKHAVLELVLTHRPVLAGDEIGTRAGKYKVPREVIEQCEDIREFIQMFKDTHGRWVVQTEAKVEIGSHLWPNVKPGECAGTVDCFAFEDTELLVLDAKFGFRRVEARGNPQLYLYANGLLGEIPLDIEHVTVCIAQPGYDGVVEFREHRISADDLREWALSVQPIVEEIQAGSYRLQADDTACGYCPARTQCPARMEALERAQNTEWFQEANLPELLPLLPRIRAICDDLEKAAMRKLNTGEEVQGWKLVASKSTRKWPLGPTGEPDELALRRIIAEGVRAKLEDKAPAPYLLDFYKKKLRSPAELAKALRVAINGGAGRGLLTVKDAEAIVNEAAIKPTGAPKLAPATDPRPALEPAAWTEEDILAGQLAASTFTPEED